MMSKAKCKFFMRKIIFRQTNFIMSENPDMNVAHLAAASDPLVV